MISTSVSNTIKRKLSSRGSRKCLSHSIASTSKKRLEISNNIHEPPLIMRIALVSSSTALCTPIFPAIGFLNVVLRAAIRDTNFRYKLSGIGGSILSFAFYTIVPYSYQYAPLLLPCAIGNGAAAGSAYAILDLISGGPSSEIGKKLLRNPLLTGGGIGAFTGICAPFYLYGPIYKSLYGLEGISDILNNLPMIKSVSVTTGLIAGVAMYPILHYPIYGIQGINWSIFSGSLLLGTTSLLFYIYNPDDENVMKIPEGSFVASKNRKLLDTIIRYDVKEGTFGAYSLTLNDYVGGIEQKEKGQRIAESVRNFQSTGGWSYGNRTSYTFDNQVLSVLGNLFSDGKVAEKFKKNLVKVKDVKEINKCEESMFHSDWIVKCITERNNTSKTTKSMAREEADIEKLKKYSHITSERERISILKNFEAVSIGVELLMIEDKKNASASDISREDIENWVRKQCPGILLYKAEEMYMDGASGQSVESQLEQIAWNQPNFNKALSNWKDLEANRKKTILHNGLLVGTASILMSSFFIQLYR